MTIVMKLFLLAGLAAGLMSAQTLQSVHSVYVFPMKNSFDQYLVDRMVREHVFQVVSDPTKADAVFTDHLGQSFEDSFDDRVLDLETSTSDVPHRVFSSARGTLFLVNRAKQVMWSDFEKPGNVAPRDLDRKAARAVKRLEAAINPKPVSPPS